MSAPRRIAIVIDLEWPMKHHHGVFAGAEQLANERGWEYTVWNHYPGTFKREGRRKAYDGIIGRITSELARDAGKQGIPLVNTWLSSPTKNIPMVCQDERHAGGMAARHLEARGIRRFGYLGFRNARFSREQREGYFASCKDSANATCQMLIPRKSVDHPVAWRRFHRELVTWINEWELPIGIYAASDMLARNIANAAQQEGLRIPDDVTILGTGNEEVVCLRPEPSLSSIEYGFERIGYRAGEVLAKLMRGGKPPAEPLLVSPSELIARTSTDAFAVDDDLVARALRFMAEECHRPIKVHDVVDAVPASSRSLVRRFKAVRGRSMASELARIRLERVRRLLVETDMPIKQVAASGGYGSATRLSEQFRKAMGMTPTEFREQRAAVRGGSV